MIEGVHYYFDENQNLVMTERYHLERGDCCGNGCRHCPYDFRGVANVAERENLMQKRRLKSSD